MGLVGFVFEVSDLEHVFCLDVFAFLVEELVVFEVEFGEFCSEFVDVVSGLFQLGVWLDGGGCGGVVVHGVLLVGCLCLGVLYWGGVFCVVFLCCCFASFSSFGLYK